MLIGTVSYIAPELVTHGHADTRCDVYALGVMLFEMLTGRKPHTGDTPIQVAYSHVHNEITPPFGQRPRPVARHPLRRPGRTWTRSCSPRPPASPPTGPRTPRCCSTTCARPGTPSSAA